MVNLNQAKFGDKYICRNGKIAVFVAHHRNVARVSSHYCVMIVEGMEETKLWNYDGTAKDKMNELDIVGGQNV